MTKYDLVNEETIIKQFDASTDNNQSTLILTNKRFYAYEQNGEITNNSIIDLNSIDSIEIDRTEHKKNITLPAIISMLIVLTGIIISVSITQYLWLILSGIGVVIFIFTLILGASHYTNDLIIHSHGISHFIDISFLTPQQVDDFQRQILHAKDDLEKSGATAH